jgi:hypothetical protein
MTTRSLRTVVRNAAAVFSGCYGAVTRRAEQVGCSRQTVYQHARQVERRLPGATRIVLGIRREGPRAQRTTLILAASPFLFPGSWE